MAMLIFFYFFLFFIFGHKQWLPKGQYWWWSSNRSGLRGDWRIKGREGTANKLSYLSISYTQSTIYNTFCSEIALWDGVLLICIECWGMAHLIILSESDSRVEISASRHLYQNRFSLNWWSQGASPAVALKNLDQSGRNHQSLQMPRQSLKMPR